MSNRRRMGRPAFPWAVHPIWRGIGCIFAVLIPILSFALADVILGYLASTGVVAESPSEVLPLFGEVQNFWVLLALGVLLIPAFYLALNVLGAILYSALGGPRNERLAEMKYREPHSYDQDSRD